MAQVDGRSDGEVQELDCYAEIGDDLSFVNRTARHLISVETSQAS
jgi:hypothetical protein